MNDQRRHKARSWWIVTFHLGVMALLIGTSYDVTGTISTVLVITGCILAVTGFIGIGATQPPSPKYIRAFCTQDWVDWIEDELFHRPHRRHIPPWWS